jgi:ABC-type Zn uptake system ZnuABC Zn-binding protein ZnuA
LRFAILIFLPLLILVASCSSVDQPDSAKLNVVASSQIIGDVVLAISGDLVEVTFIIPPGTDPHAYEPSPQDAISFAEANIIFINGFGLEEALQPLLAEHGDKVIDISEGIQPLTLHEEGESGPDPHVWMDPLNVKIWVDNITETLGAADTTNASTYSANAETYKAEIDELDDWALEQIDRIPQEDRVLVTDHESFSYFASHYGFEIIGTVIPSYSTLSEPSAGELAQLESSIQEFGVKAIFVGVSLNPSLAQQVAEDTGIQLVPIYTESLSDSNGPAANFLEMIRYDVEAIVAALSNAS